MERDVLNTLVEIYKDMLDNPDDEDKKKRWEYALGDFKGRLNDGAIENFDAYFADIGEHMHGEERYHCPDVDELSRGELLAMSTYVDYYEFDQYGNLWERWY